MLVKQASWRRAEKAGTYKIELVAPVLMLSEFDLPKAMVKWILMVSLFVL